MLTKNAAKVLHVLGLMAAQASWCCAQPSRLCSCGSGRLLRCSGSQQLLLSATTIMCQSNLHVDSLMLQCAPSLPLMLLLPAICTQTADLGRCIVPGA